MLGRCLGPIRFGLMIGRWDSGVVFVSVCVHKTVRLSSLGIWDSVNEVNLLD